MPTVSVIVPNYNHSKYLNQRIDSILGQTYQDFELLILDDMSSDNSKEVIETYRNHPKVSQIVYNDVNSGTTFKQWKKGIELAKGTLIWIAESDDWCENNLLKTLVAGINANPNCILGYVQSYTVLNSNDILQQSFYPKIAEQLNGEDFIKKHLVWGPAIFNASMALFKKEAYFALSNDYTTYKFSGDWLFWIGIARQGNVFISGKVLNYFRKHAKDVSGKAYASGLNFVENIRILNALHADRLIDATLYKTALTNLLIYYKAKKHLIDKSNIQLVEQMIDESGYKQYVRAKAAVSSARLKVTTALRKLGLAT